MDERPGHVPRRRLFGALGRSLRELAGALDEGVRAAGPSPASRPGRADDAPPPRAAHLPRVLRPAAEVAAARPDGFEAWRSDLRLDDLAVGASMVLRGDDLPEPFVVVRVNAVHVTAASAECPADGSDLVWSGPDDRLRCPSCRSRWRLDGEPMDGPSNAPLAVFFVTAEPDGLRITRP